MSRCDILLAVTGCLFMSHTAPCAEPPKPEELLRDRALAVFRESDSVAAVAPLTDHPNPLLAAQTFGLVMRQLYWKEKNLPATLAFGRAGVQHGLSAAARLAATDPAQAGQLRSIAKGLCYDLASFTWPGWDEPGVVPTPADIAVGLDAAKANLRLARELEKGDLPLSRAHWMLGAQLLASREPAAAQASFQSAALHARKAGVEAEGLLSDGFCQLSRLLAGDDPAPRRQLLSEIIAKLKPLPDGEFFASQITTAEKVFGGSR